MWSLKMCRSVILSGKLGDEMICGAEAVCKYSRWIEKVLTRADGCCCKLQASPGTESRSAVAGYRRSGMRQAPDQ